MKFSLNWIRNFVDLPVEAGLLTANKITARTAECEGVEEIGDLLAAAVVARVEAVAPIEGSHNVQATVDAGRYGRKTVVCGAKNCRTGIYTVYVPVGVRTVAGV